MTSEQLQAAILPELLARPLDQFQIAGRLDEPPFRIRGELRALRRRRLVKEIHAPEFHGWQLTASGLKSASDTQQLSLLP